MSKLITIKLTSAGPMSQLFEITDPWNNVIADDVSRNTLVQGISYLVNDNATFVIITSKGKCPRSKTIPISVINTNQLASAKFIETKTACLWRHLTNTELYNSFYGTTYPFILEYPFAYQYHDQILQSIKNYSKVFEYRPDGTGVFSYTDKIEVDNRFFNKLVVYNDQQSSGVLELVSKPKNNLNQYLSYPKYNTDSKTIIYTKSDSFYNINTFWDIVKDKKKQLFITSCENLSIDRIVNQDNMIYTNQSFKKATIRAKDTKIRFILDNASDINIVSQFVISSEMISYK